MTLKCSQSDQQDSDPHLENDQRPGEMGGRVSPKNVPQNLSSFLGGSRVSLLVQPEQFLILEFFIYLFENSILLLKKNFF